MIWAIVVVMMVINVGVLTFTTIYGDNDSVDITAFEIELENLRFQLGSAQQEIDSLKEEIRIIEIGDTSQDIGVIEIYNQTRNSVVLIETNTGTGILRRQ